MNLQEFKEEREAGDRKAEKALNKARQKVKKEVIEKVTVEKIQDVKNTESSTSENSPSIVETNHDEGIAEFDSARECSPRILVKQMKILIHNMKQSQSQIMCLT